MATRATDFRIKLSDELDYVRRYSMTTQNGSTSSSKFTPKEGERVQIIDGPYKDRMGEVIAKYDDKEWRVAIDGDGKVANVETGHMTSAK